MGSYFEYQIKGVGARNEKEKFKKEFTRRLIKFSIKVLNFAEKAKEKRILWSIIDQLIRSATSIGANVIEAKASSSRKDYIKFFEIALKSANETLYWLIILKEMVPAEQKEETQSIYNEALEISKIIASSVLTLKGKK